MNESIGPRTYLVGKLLPVMLSIHERSYNQNDEAVIERVLAIVDATLDKMQWPEGKPKA